MVTTNLFLSGKSTHTGHHVPVLWYFFPKLLWAVADSQNSLIWVIPTVLRSAGQMLLQNAPQLRFIFCPSLLDSSSELVVRKTLLRKNYFHFMLSKGRTVSLTQHRYLFFSFPESILSKKYSRAFLGPSIVA